MIQCCTCMVWHHSECTSVSSETTGIWNCDKCRSIPQAIDHLTNQLNEMHSLLSSMVEKQNDLYEQFCQMNIKNSKLEGEVKLLKSENLKLRLRTYNNLNSASSISSDSDSDVSSWGDDSIHLITLTISCNAQIM